MQQTQTEIQNKVDSDPENIVGTVSVSGTPVTVHRTDAKDISWAMVRNPSKGSRANGINTVLYVTVDGQAPSTKGLTLARGEWATFSGMIYNSNGIRVDSNANGANFEITAWG